MNPHAHRRISRTTNALWCGCRWLRRRHVWRVARRAKIGSSLGGETIYELRFECERCGYRCSMHSPERALWELGIELPEVAQEAPRP